MYRLRYYQPNKQLMAIKSNYLSTESHSPLHIYQLQMMWISVERARKMYFGYFTLVGITSYMTKLNMA